MLYYALVFLIVGLIAGALGISLEDARQVVEGIIAANNASLAADFTDKRSDLKSKILKTYNET